MLQLNDYSKAVVKGSIWALLGNILFKFSSFFYVILIARMASQEDVGLFYLSLAIVSIIEIFSNAGIPLSLQRYIPFFEGKKEFNKLKYLLKLSYAVIAVLGTIFIALLWFASDFIGELYDEPLLPNAIRLFSVYIILNAAFRLNYTYLQGRTDIKSMQLLTNMQNGLKLLLTFALFMVFGATAATLVIGYLLSLLLALIISVPFIRRKVVDLPKSRDAVSASGLVREIAPFGMMLTMISMLWIIIGTLDKLLIGYFLPDSAETVAVYSIAATFAGVLLMIPISVANIFLPVMSRLAAGNDRGSMHNITESASRWTIYLTFPAATVMIAFAHPMLSIFYGENYAFGSAVMAILTAAFLIQSFSFMLSNLLAAIRMVRIELQISAAVTVINVILNVLLIPAFGIEGAAIASLASIMVLYLLLYHFTKKVFNFSFSMQFYKIILAGFLTLGSFLLISPYLIAVQIPSFGPENLQFLISKVAYLAYLGIVGILVIPLFVFFSIILKSISSDDISMLKSGFAKYGIPAQLTGFLEKILILGVK
ncbi:flippase [Candidatus Micrarchaeota archaeon]|nr:flippase [Candidatus Micrarchaeota archaeon]